MAARLPARSNIFLSAPPDGRPTFCPPDLPGRRLLPGNFGNPKTKKYVNLLKKKDYFVSRRNEQPKPDVFRENSSIYGPLDVIISSGRRLFSRAPIFARLPDFARFLARKIEPYAARFARPPGFLPGLPDLPGPNVPPGKGIVDTNNRSSE